MELKGKDLTFISWIRRDGTGVDPVSQDLIDMMQEETFEISSLSLSFDTYIAHNINSFVVKIKKPLLNKS